MLCVFCRISYRFCVIGVFFFKQKTAYEMRISDWSSDVCSSDLTTGQEIWEQTDGKVDAFVCAVGTGGTLAGVAQALRERKKDVVIGLADPLGAALYNYYAHGPLKAEGSSISERSEGRRVGKEGVSTCRSRWSPSP